MTRLKGVGFTGLNMPFRQPMLDALSHGSILAFIDPLEFGNQGLR